MALQIVILISLFSVNSVSAMDLLSIQVDQLGRPLDPSQDECNMIRTIGIFDLLDIPMDVKQIMACVQHLLCYYNYDVKQNAQLEVCLKVGVNNSIN